MVEFAVVLLFDPAAERKLKDLQETVWLQETSPEPEVSYRRPHITLAGLKGISRTELTGQVQAFAEDEACLSVELDAVGTFPGSEGVVYIAPVVTSELLGFHRRFLDSLGERCVLLRDHYRQGRWTPHCTIALYLPETQMPAAFRLCRDSNVFGSARLVDIAVIEFPAAEEVGAYVLGSQGLD